MRFPARSFLTGVVLVATASCFGDRPLSPNEVSVRGNPALRALVIAQTADFVIPAGGGDISLFGVYALQFPAGAVCDPNANDTQTGYANAAWDSPCTAVSGDVRVRATAKWTGERLYIDFQPALRFVPSKTVRLSSDAFAASLGSDEGGLPIYYAPGLDGTPVADALTDPSVRTTVHGNSGKITRRVKHFSGYVIVDTQIPCDPLQGNPLCVWVDDDGFGH